MLLSELSHAVLALRELPREECPDAVRRLLPELVELAGDERVGEETRVRLLTRALHALHPSAPRIDDPQRALRELTAALAPRVE